MYLFNPHNCPRMIKKLSVLLFFLSRVTMVGLSPKKETEFPDFPAGKMLSVSQHPFPGAHCVPRVLSAKASAWRTQYWPAKSEGLGSCLASCAASIIKVEGQLTFPFLSVSTFICKWSDEVDSLVFKIVFQFWHSLSHIIPLLQPLGDVRDALASLVGMPWLTPQGRLRQSQKQKWKSNLI